MSNPERQVVQDTDQSIAVMHAVGEWMEQTGKNPSKWWQPDNLNAEFLLRYAKSEEFYVVLIEDTPVAAAVLQIEQSAQDWQDVGEHDSEPALYIHWLCVNREFAGQGLPQTIVDFAVEHAREQGISWLRVDTNASEVKLREIYEELGFTLVAVKDEGYRQTAFYQLSAV